MWSTYPRLIISGDPLLAALNPLLLRGVRKAEPAGSGGAEGGRSGGRLAGGSAPSCGRRRSGGGGGDGRQGRVRAVGVALQVRHLRHQILQEVETLLRLDA